MKTFIVQESLQVTTILLSTQKPKKKQSHFIIKVTMQIVMLIGTICSMTFIFVISGRTHDTDN